jgi:hypothetical protein
MENIELDTRVYRCLLYIPQPEPCFMLEMFQRSEICLFYPTDGRYTIVEHENINFDSITIFQYISAEECSLWINDSSLIPEYQHGAILVKNNYHKSNELFIYNIELTRRYELPPIRQVAKSNYVFICQDHLYVFKDNTLYKFDVQGNKLSKISLMADNLYYHDGKMYAVKDDTLSRINMDDLCTMWSIDDIDSVVSINSDEVLILSYDREEDEDHEDGLLYYSISVKDGSYYISYDWYDEHVSIYISDSHDILIENGKYSKTSTIRIL